MGNVCISVDPGICGFPCHVKAWKKEKRVVGIEVAGSECQMIRKFSAGLDELTLKDLFLPLTRNPIFVNAERAGCHLACPVPVAVAKAAEASLTLALPKDVTIHFETVCND